MAVTTEKRLVYPAYCESNRFLQFGTYVLLAFVSFQLCGIFQIIQWVLVCFIYLRIISTHRGIHSPSVCQTEN